jgi:upstream activation factor subunit UAF30
VPPELEEKYTIIIDAILASSDLTTISAKRVRKGVGVAAGDDISPYKVRLYPLVLNLSGLLANPPSQEEINKLILQRFDIAEANGTHTTPNGTKYNLPPAATNGKRSPPSDEPSSASSPRPKKHRPSKSIEDADAAYAARLQAEENGRARSTRGGGVTKRKPIVKRTPFKKVKTKSKAKVGSDDDSDAASGAEKEVTRTGGFHV